MSKVSWLSQLSYRILWTSFERKFRKTSFLQNSPPKKPGSLGLRITKRQSMFLPKLDITSMIVYKKACCAKLSDLRKTFPFRQFSSKLSVFLWKIWQIWLFFLSDHSFWERKINDFFQCLLWPIFIILRKLNTVTIDAPKMF